MKNRLPIFLVALSAVAAVLIWSESRSTAIMAAQGFHTARKEVREPAIVRQLDRQVAAVDDAFSRITGFAVVGVLLSGISLVLLIRGKNPNPSVQPALGSIDPRAK